MVFAALNRDERHHQRCVELLASRSPVVLPAPVITETTMLSRSRDRPQAVDALLRSVVDGTVAVVELELADYSRARQLVAQYADLGLSFVDAAVVAIAERFEETTIATLDHRHFSVVKPLHCEAFTLVP
ncbi:MAG TPA: PIN domain-containing protein [Gaiellaceae bacterium]|nr:PIN domain-containing protein [Gaiellaceae bacterium]HLG08768.1 PIN domain-containing protein [Gaiellaceae bacterium]